MSKAINCRYDRTTKRMILKPGALLAKWDHLTISDIFNDWDNAIYNLIAATLCGAPININDAMGRQPLSLRHQTHHGEGEGVIRVAPAFTDMTPSDRVVLLRDVARQIDDIRENYSSVIVFDTRGRAR